MILVMIPWFTILVLVSFCFVYVSQYCYSLQSSYLSLLELLWVASSPFVLSFIFFDNQSKVLLHFYFSVLDSLLFCYFSHIFILWGRFPPLSQSFMSKGWAHHCLCKYNSWSFDQFEFLFFLISYIFQFYPALVTLLKIFPWHGYVQCFLLRIFKVFCLYKKSELIKALLSNFFVFDIPRLKLYMWKTFLRMLVLTN